MNRLQLLVLAGTALLSAGSQASLIFAEDFSSPNTLIGNGWGDSDGGGLEVYNSRGARARGMRSTFDHDNNPLTPEIAITGGLEINDDAGNVTLWSEVFEVNQEVNYWEIGTLSYFAGVRRNNAQGAYVELLNLTQNFSLTGRLTPNFNGGNWQFNSFDFGWGTTQQGDELQIVWSGGGDSSANGQQVANVSVVRVPAPATIGVLALGLLSARLFRKTK